jgi:hypothetical protein
VPQVRCEIIRWVADEPQPGMVEAQIIDVDGHVWRFVDKAPIFSAEVLLPSPAIRSEASSDVRSYPGRARLSRLTPRDLTGWSPQGNDVPHCLL